MDDDQQFCLRWNNHQSTLVAVFDTLLENEKLVDCTLAAEGKFLNAHKVVLSACSPYFESLLSRHYDKHPILILKDVKFQELKAMMDYMYRGEVNISQDQLGALLKAAESLQIKGLSDNKKDDQPTKRPAPAPAPPKSPQPQAQLPKVQGLTIEQRSRDDREGSMSPGPRKKKRMRRKSEEMDNHHDASNSSDAHSLPPQNIPSATTQLPANIKLNSDVPETIETKQEILTRHKEEIGSQQPQVPMIKEKLETHTELMLEPKSEYVEEMNEDSIEDLTLDDDDLSNMDQMDDGAGPSHGGEGSSQGFGHWQMGNQSQDEVFLAAQEAVGAHRDSQGSSLRESQFSRRRDQYEQRRDFERRPLPSYYTSHQREINLPGERRSYNVPIQPKSARKPIPQKIVQKSRPFSSTNPISNEKPSAARKPQTFVAPSQPKFSSKPGPQKPTEKDPQLDFKKTPEDQNVVMFKKHEESSYVKFNKPSFQEPPEKRHPMNTKNLADDQRASRERNYREFQEPPHPKFTTKAPSQKANEQRPSFSVLKPTGAQGSGLLTDSLSCIFTRRPQKNNQHKIPQKRVFFEEVPQCTEDQKEKEDQVSDTESTYLTEKRPKCETPEKQCPEPPIISQATPNISNEDWFATKQRILSSVNHDPPPKSICEPQQVRENKCPEPPQISVDPHGFDIEPPDHLNKNVSPYVPTNSFERDEYNKYKTQQLKKEAALILAQKRYKQGFEAPSVKSKAVQETKQPLTSYLKDNEGKEITDNSSFKEASNYQQYQRFESEPPSTQQEIPAYEPKTTVYESHQQAVTYEPTQRYESEPLVPQNQNMQEYEYQRSSYNTASYEQAQDYENVPSGYQIESSAYYDEQNAYKDSSYNEPLPMYAAETVPSYEMVAQTNYEDQNDLKNMCPEAPHISDDTNVFKDKSREDFENIPPEAPVISQGQVDNAHSYYQDDNYECYDNFEEQNRFKEPLSLAATQGIGVGNQKMCHRCSFQTTNAKKLRDHLKFVHGESAALTSPSGAQKSNELFSRREPKPTEGQNELFSRRDASKQEDVAPERDQQKQFHGRFKRRNTAVVNIISTDIIVPVRKETGETGGDNEGEAGHEGEKSQGKTQDSGVLAALEYFETTKDQPKKPRPYRRNPDELLDDDWI